MPGTVLLGSCFDLNPYDYVKCLYSSTIQTPYSVAFAKRVLCPKQKEQDLIQAVLKEGLRERTTGLYFRVDTEKVRSIFDTIEGTYIE